MQIHNLRVLILKLQLFSIEMVMNAVNPKQEEIYYLWRYADPRGKGQQRRNYDEQVKDLPRLLKERPPP